MSLTTTSIVAYAVHVDGAMWDDPRISAWCENVHDAADMLVRAADFFADDEDFAVNEPNGGLLTIVRAVFTSAEWEQTRTAGWTVR